MGGAHRAEYARVLVAPPRPYIYGSWAARHEGQAEQCLGRPVQATIRERAWLEAGSGAFHKAIISRPLVKLAVAEG